MFELNLKTLILADYIPVPIGEDDDDTITNACDIVRSWGYTVDYVICDQETAIAEIYLCENSLQPA